MTQAIELNSVRRGYDPREFTLVAAGGAGPLFACDIALELEIPACSSRRTRASSRRRACWPRTSSTSSSPRSGTRSRASTSTASHGGTKSSSRGGRPARCRRCARGRRLVRRLADCRYAGQGYEVRSEVPAGAVDEAWVWSSRSVPRRARAEYGHRFDAPIEIINIRAVAIGRVEELQPTEAGVRHRRSVRCEDARARGGFRGRRRAERHLTPFYERDSCAPGTGWSGPRSSSSTTRPR